MIPLKFIRVSEDMSICATRIIAIMSTHAYQTRRLIKDEKKANTLLNAAGRGAVRSAIILDNGTVIASPLTIKQIFNNINNADSKSSNGRKIRQSTILKLYDIIPDEALDEKSEDYPELEAIEGEVDQDEPELNTGDFDGDEETEDVLGVAWDGEVDEE